MCTVGGSVLTDVRLRSTYGDLLEGYPCARLNDWQVAALPRQAERIYPSLPVHPIEPTRTHPERVTGPTTLAFGPVESLPDVACIGLFTSTPVDPAVDQVLHRSDLLVVWFQTGTVPLIAEDAVSAFTALPWDELALDSER